MRCFPDEMVGCIYLLYLKMQELFGEDICILKETLTSKANLATYELKCDSWHY